MHCILAIDDHDNDAISNMIFYRTHSHCCALSIKDDQLLCPFPFLLTIQTDTARFSNTSDLVYLILNTILQRRTSVNLISNTKYFCNDFSSAMSHRSNTYCSYIDPKQHMKTTTINVSIRDNKICAVSYGKAYAHSFVPSFHSFIN